MSEQIVAAEDFHNTSSNCPRRILRKAEVEERTGKGSTQLWRGVKDGTVPKPVQIGPNSIGWFEDEIDEWQENLPRVNYAPEQVDVANDTAEEPEKVDPKPVDRKVAAAVGEPAPAPAP